MGILTDLFVAGGAEVEALGSGLSVDDFEVLKAYRIDPVKIVTLDEILTGEKTEIPGLIAASDGGECCIFGLRSELCRALAGLTAGELTTAAGRWAQTEEWRRDGGTPIELADWLEKAGRLAKLAEREAKNLYIRIGL